MTEPLLEVRQLRKLYPQKNGFLGRNTQYVHAVDGVSFAIHPGETLGLVGESGCGKSTLGRSILNLEPASEGEIIFKGKNLTTLSKAEWRDLRREIQIIFQDPYESLNQRHTVGQILEEPFLIHNVGTSQERKNKAVELLERVGLSSDAMRRFPHEFSGGQRQRIGIARAIALNPSLIVCDEAVSALDVSVQAQILNLLLELQQEMQLTLLFIAHDLSVVKFISDRVMVMYLGKIVELAPSNALYQNPQHPYTQALISAIPKVSVEKPSKRIIVSGEIPSPLAPPSGCRFHDRCPKAQALCSQQEPLLNTDSHRVACHFPGPIN